MKAFEFNKQKLIPRVHQPKFDQLDKVNDSNPVLNEIEEQPTDYKHFGHSAEDLAGVLPSVAAKIKNWD